MTGGGSSPPGGPLYSTYSSVLYIYQTAVRSLDMGYGATLSIGLFVIMFAITLIQFKLTVKPVDY
jgi:ABC-type sugar transport system permease subunit